MFKRVKKSDLYSTFIGAEASIEGTLEFTGTVRIDGQVKGKVLSDGGVLIVGEQGRVHGDIVVDEARIYGEVRGNIDAKEKIEVTRPGRVTGDIRSPAITIGKGVVFDGNCGMKSGNLKNL